MTDSRTPSVALGDKERAEFANLFARQAIPMVWDFGEAGPFVMSRRQIRGELDVGGEALDS